MQLYLLVNEKCNLKCGFCIRGKGIQEQLDIKKFNDVLEINDFSKYTIMISGGEPSLFDELPQLIDICYGKFKKICINTNGVNSDWLDRFNIMDIHVQISIDWSST